MTSNGQSKPQRAGLSLYANLLDSSSNGTGAPGTISKAPVLFNKTGGDQSQSDEASQKQQLSAGRYKPAPLRGHGTYANRIAHGFSAFALH